MLLTTGCCIKVLETLKHVTLLCLVSGLSFIYTWLSVTLPVSMCLPLVFRFPCPSHSYISLHSHMHLSYLLSRWHSALLQHVSCASNCSVVPVSEDGLVRKQLDTTGWPHKATASFPRMKCLWHWLLQISHSILLKLPSPHSHTYFHILMLL